MRFCYQYATPDVAKSFTVTAYQGELEESFRAISGCGYDAVELMARDVKGLDCSMLRNLLTKYNLEISLICTGEVFGQGGINLSDEDPEVRSIARERLTEMIDLAALFHANINIGRVRGSFRDRIPEERTRQLAIASLKELSAYAESKNVKIALEPICMLQTRFINTVDQAARFCDEVGSPAFGYMMDLYHMNVEEKDILQTIHRFGAECLHVHLADSNRQFPGRGHLNFSEILSAFYKAGYNHDFSVEIWQLPDQNTAALQSAKVLQPPLNAIYGRRIRP